MAVVLPFLPHALRRAAARGRAVHPVGLTLLHVAAPAQHGGLERVLGLLARSQLAYGHEVHVAAIIDGSPSAYPVLAELRASGVHVHALEIGRRDYLGEREAVAELCHGLRPAVVHTHGYRPDLLDAPVARRAGCAIVTTVHGFTGGDLKNRAYQFLQRRALHEFDAVAAVSNPLRDALRRSGIPADRLHTVRNAFERDAAPMTRDAARHRLGLPADAYVVGWVGRCSREKGADVLLASLARTSSGSAVVSMIGDGPERTALAARRLPIGLDVRWHGAVAEAGRHFPAFDVFVMSSRSEGTPMVLFEAMAAGVPIVATTVGGIPDVVSAAEALLIPPENPAALAAALDSVRDDPLAAYERAARASARLTREHSTGPWVHRYNAVYRAALTTQAGLRT